jgi:hypothetical protein
MSAILSIAFFLPALGNADRPIVRRFGRLPADLDYETPAIASFCLEVFVPGDLAKVQSASGLCAPTDGALQR